MLPKRGNQSLQELTENLQNCWILSHGYQKYYHGVPSYKKDTDDILKIFLESKVFGDHGRKASWQFSDKYWQWKFVLTN